MTHKAEVEMGKLLGLLFISAGKGDLGLRFGNSDLKMKEVSKGVVPKAGWVLPSVFGVSLPEE